jgi:hypothetical protein
MVRERHGMGQVKTGADQGIAARQGDCLSMAARCRSRPAWAGMDPRVLSLRGRGEGGWPHSLSPRARQPISAVCSMGSRHWHDVERDSSRDPGQTGNSEARSGRFAGVRDLADIDLRGDA